MQKSLSRRDFLASAGVGALAVRLKPALVPSFGGPTAAALEAAQRGAPAPPEHRAGACC